ncbi:hypothetical protein VTJ83DRAFT_4168 [Remersonia thermophila]|uniref:Tubulin-specific chaperone D C-terminal domain-containing protein n=1 Tax=Remersonia thermophila TaxID=72144 RepID=A0ABR4D963_9PEZI
MDAPEQDLDIKLHKISGDLIADFDRSLPRFLRKNDGAGGSVVRSRVRTRETDRLISSLLDPFQELPQLLDPHLPKWLPQLADAYLEHLLARRPCPPARGRLLTPLPRAICRLLYSFCKIRGEKVVVRFLPNEARYLEPLLTALEDAERVAASRKDQGQAQGQGQGQHDDEQDDPAAWSWEERYVVLLWLSHLLLAPFDLSTMSTREEADEEETDGGLPSIPGRAWPVGLPSIATRVLPIALRYLAAPGRERDASRAVLVRLAMRRDMQQLGLLDALVRWALAALRPDPNTLVQDEQRTPYHYTGVLSFLGGVLKASADTQDMQRYLCDIFAAVHGMAATPASEPGSPTSSALARKAAIKVVRAVTVQLLHGTPDIPEAMDNVEIAIGFLLDSLADNDTPVRFAASKALSIVTLRLEADMADQVVEAVLEALKRNVLPAKKGPGAASGVGAAAACDLSMVDPLEWHGLMLTLAHLLYRRSLPNENLPDIVRALLQGLAFERRSTSGASTGGNVRDAACFGIWSLARRYYTAELLAVPAASLSGRPDESVLQTVAVELVAAACLDPSGNIRRGASAALQELVGRHPDTIDQGIWLVQTVDYHAVALRSRALRDVALGATRLAPRYGEAILAGLLGWRGVGDVDTASRRAAGAAYGIVTAELALVGGQDPAERLTQSVTLVLDALRALETRQVDERHGLLYALAAVLDALPGVTAARMGIPQEFVCLSGEALLNILRDCDTKTYRKPELIAEAASRLIVSAFPVLQAISDPSAFSLLLGSTLRTMSGTELAALARSSDANATLDTFATLARSNLQRWLTSPEPEIIAAASDAAVVLALASRSADRDAVIRGWADAARARLSSKTRTTSGHFSALAAVYPLAATTAAAGCDEEEKELIRDALVERWKADTWTDTRACILQSLVAGVGGNSINVTGTGPGTISSEGWSGPLLLLRQNAEVFVKLVSEGLDDYTTTARGDIGSNVRYEALRVTRALWADMDANFGQEERERLVSALLLRVLRLAAEKLDRVRAQAQATLAMLLKKSQALELRRSTFSSKAYFLFLLDLLHHPDWLHPAAATVLADSAAWMDALLSGMVTSADTGHEELVIASRTALVEFCCEQDDPNLNARNTSAICASLARNLRAWQGVDRVLVPTLEVTAFLLDMGLFARCEPGVINHKNVCLQVQKACYKTGNVRKIEACVRVYAGIAELGRAVEPASAVDTRREGGGAEKEATAKELAARRDGAREARVRLGALLFHPWPRVRSTVVDELWGLYLEEPAGKQLRSVDWARADKARIRAAVEALGLA